MLTQQQKFSELNINEQIIKLAELLGNYKPSEISPMEYSVLHKLGRYISNSHSFLTFSDLATIKSWAQDRYSKTPQRLNFYSNLHWGGYITEYLADMLNKKVNGRLIDEEIIKKYQLNASNYKNLPFFEDTIGLYIVSELDSERDYFHLNSLKDCQDIYYCLNYYDCKGQVDHTKTRHKIKS